MSDHDAIRRDLGVYVLGALDPAERDRVEQHLAECAACRDEVASLAVLPGLLTRLGHEDVDAPAPPPSDAVVARIVAQRRREVRRSRLLAAVAAIVVVAALGAVALTRLAPAGQRFVADSADVTATVEERPWGMAVHIDAEQLPAGRGYVAVAVRDDGHRTQVASWSATGGAASIAGACYLKPAQVDRLEILNAPEESVVAVLRPAT